MTYGNTDLTRTEVDQMAGAGLLVFGADGCGFCAGSEPAIDAAIGEFPTVRVIMVADGKGRPLGRSFAVKLWPTLVFLRDGQEVDRLVRPTAPASIREALARIV